MPSRPRALFVMPGFSRFAERRAWRDLETFFNPLETFERVVIASPGEERGREIGSLEVAPLPPARPRPWALLVGEDVYGRRDPLAGAVRRLAEDRGVDLLAQRYGGPLFHGLPAVWAARRLGLPALVTLQNDYAAILDRKPFASRVARRRLDAPVWRYLFRHATALWCVSEHVRGLAAGAGAPGAKLVTIPNKEAIGRFASPEAGAAARLVGEIALPGWQERRPLFLSVGRLIAQKNYFSMLQAFADFAAAHPGAAWIVVGRGPLRPRLERRVRRLGLERSVHFVRRDLSLDELAALYHAADALLFASRFEGHGRVVYEALACGTPVIGSSRPPITDMVVDGETGATVDPEAVSEISAAMERVASGELAKARLGERCRAVARRYDLERVNPLEADLYRRLIAKGGP